MTKTRRVLSAEPLPPTGNDREEKAPQRAATEDPFADLRVFISKPSRDSTVAAAVIDANFFCVGLNDAFSALRISLEKPCAGKPVGEVFAAYGDLIEKKLREVAQSGAPVFNVELPSGWIEASKGRQWVADLFPLRVDGHSTGLLGTAVSEGLSRKYLKRFFFDSTIKVERSHSKGKNLNGDDSSQALAQYFAVSWESARLLNASRSLRGYLSCLRVARKLHKGSLPGLIDSPKRFHSLSVLPASLGAELPPSQTNPADGNGNRLSPWPSSRELQVLQLLAQGKGNKEIGALLQLSTRTVESYRARLKLRLNLHSEAEMVRYAIRNHIIEP
jgi:DNA-binding CsgD family transcriptional regulator